MNADQCATCGTWLLKTQKMDARAIRITQDGRALCATCYRDEYSYQRARARSDAGQSSGPPPKPASNRNKEA